MFGPINGVCGPSPATISMSLKLTPSNLSLYDSRWHYKFLLQQYWPTPTKPEVDTKGVTVMIRNLVCCKYSQRVAFNNLMTACIVPSLTSTTSSAAEALGHRRGSPRRGGT